MFSKIAKGIKTLGLFGILFASLAVAVAVASPSAASANSIGPGPVAGYGSLSVTLLYPSSPANDLPATVSVFDSNGNGVIKALAAAGTTGIAKLPAGKYLVTVSKAGYNTLRESVEVVADADANVTFGMQIARSTVRNPRIGR
jgi:hypothetical protein